MACGCNAGGFAFAMGPVLQPICLMEKGPGQTLPCVKYEDLSDILPNGGRDTGEGSEPAQCLGDSGGAGRAGSPHHGLRRGQSSGSRTCPEAEVESHLFGLFLGGCAPEPPQNYEAVRR